MDGYTKRVTDSSALRDSLDHPVIDGDGHIIESRFVLPDFLKQVGGSKLVERFDKAFAEARPGGAKSVFWNGHTGALTIDRVTTMLPKLYALRLEEAGVDFATLYATVGFRCQVMPDDEVRQASCRALNMMFADMFADVSDRMTPAAVIPMHTPEEAIEELEFAVNELGLKAAMTCNEVLRPDPEVAKSAPQYADATRSFSPLALDSPYDYDPFWAKCVELKVAPAGHSINYTATHASPTNYVYNRIGLFATSSHAAVRALFISGVTKKFPELNIGFLEGGVWWAVSLYNDLIDFYEKRNVEALLDHHDPAKFDVALAEGLFRDFGNAYLTPERFLAAKEIFTRDGRTAPGIDPDFIDDWRALDIKSAEDIRDLFVDNFYFGCEADDALNYTAFNAKANKFGAKLKAMFSSDLGHWDVVDFGDVLAEAHEQTEKGLMSEEDFRDFVFTNPVRFTTRANPDYFKGTVVEDAVAKLLGSASDAA
ncbi:MAG: amidohydrolase family protein [Alphaproteobacteria bacterium]|nr:amidohydrolase family protein [Alphaproteobacteria bacterium]